MRTPRYILRASVIKYHAFASSQTESGVFVQRAIAVLDSGVGGLTVVKEIMRQLPGEPILYFGDTARAPYGPRPAHEVIRFTCEIVDDLLRFRPKMIVVACNTATALALDEIRKRSPHPVVGVIDPGARAAAGRTKSGVIGVIGTEGTIRSGAYQAALRRLSPRVRVVQLACPEFVPLVEAGKFDSPEAYGVVARSLAPLKGCGLDTLILGCTHYPFLARMISEFMGPEVALISSAEEAGREVGAVLRGSGLAAASRGPIMHRFFCSGDPRKFREIARLWLGESCRRTPTLWQVRAVG